MPLDFFNPQSDNRRLRFEIPFVRRLIDAISKRVDRDPTPTPTLETPSEVDTGSGVADTSLASSTDRLWRVQTGRRAEYRDLRSMDEEDPIVPTALDVIADCVTGYEAVDVDGFEWELRKSSPKALVVLEDGKDRLALGTEAWQIVRNFVRNGEEYREVVVDDRDRVARFKSLPSYTIAPKTDDYGNQIPGWVQYPDTGAGYGTFSERKTIPFESWQIIDFIYGAKRGHYGTGLMLPARRTWKRLQQIEDGMAIARQLRAYDKLLHRVPVKPEWNDVRVQEAVRNYKENMTKRKVLDSNSNERMVNRPLTVETDFYIPEDGTKRGNIELISSTNAQLAHIADVEYHQKLLLARTKVPRKFLNLGRGEKGVLTDGSLTAEDIQFARTLRGAQAILRRGYLQLGAFMLFLQGYDARDLGLTIRMAKISTTDALQDAKIALTWAQSAQVLAALLGGLPPELLMTHYMQLDEREQGVLRSFVATANPVVPGTPVAGDTSGQPPKVPVEATVKEVAQAFASLQGLIQEELQRRGALPNLLSHWDRTERNLDTILELTNGV